MLSQGLRPAARCLSDPLSVAALAWRVHHLAGEARYTQPVDILDAIRANRQQHRDHTDAANVLDSKLRDLVKMAFEQGCTGPELASVLGISKERVYQIRDGRR